MTVEKRMEPGMKAQKPLEPVDRLEFGMRA
jgi:hypothetical protein